MIKERQKVFGMGLVAVDMICVTVAMLLAIFFGFYFWGISVSKDLEQYIVLLGVMLACVLILFYTSGLYGAMRHRRFTREFFALFSCTIIAFTLILVVLYVFRLSHELLPIIEAAASFFVLGDGFARYALRLLLRIIRKRGYNLKYLLLVGGGGSAEQFYRKVTNNPQFGYRITACLTDDEPQGGRLREIGVAGKLSDIGRCLENGKFDEIIVALEIDEYGKLPPIIEACEKSGIKINMVPAFFNYIPSNPRLDEFDGIPVMVLRKIPLSNPLRASLKRLFDILVSLFCIVFFLPVMIVSGIVICLTTKESPIYSQERLGYNCKPFKMYKFRTMKTGCSDEWTVSKDHRRTKFGIFLRKFSIDELPQFINVLLGQMSVIGPRPEIKQFVDKFKEEIPRYMVRHQVKPGITGWAQIHNLRGDTSIEERIKSDIYYIENWTFSLDLHIMIWTCFHSFYNPNE